MRGPRHKHLLSRDDPWMQVLDLESKATRFETKSGGGAAKVVWHRWGSGHPVVLLHGGGGSWTHWLRTIPALMPHFTLWVPDLPGYGDSDLPHGLLGYDDLSDALADGAAELLPPGSHFELVTFSFGGQLAVHFARRFPERLRKLVLSGSNIIEPMGKGGLPYKNWKKAATEAERDEAIRHNLLEIMLHDPARLDDFAMRLQKDNLARQRLSPITLSGHRALCDMLAELPPKVKLAGINGDNDFIIRGRLEKQAEAYKRFRPDAEFRIIPTGSHWLMYDAAEEYNQALLEILESRAA